MQIIRECFATRLMVKSFVNMLDALDDSAAYYGMTGLSTILASGEMVKADGDDNPYTHLIEEQGGREALHRWDTCASRICAQILGYWVNDWILTLHT